jgi:hypothetical protein
MIPLQVTRTLARYHWKVTSSEWVTKDVQIAKTRVTVGLTWNTYGERSQIRIQASIDETFERTLLLDALCMRINADMAGPTWQLYPETEGAGRVMAALEWCVDVSPFVDEAAAEYAEVLAGDVAHYFHETHFVLERYRENPDLGVEALLQFVLYDIIGNA